MRAGWLYCTLTILRLTHQSRFSSRPTQHAISSCGLGPASLYRFHLTTCRCSRTGSPRGRPGSCRQEQLTPARADKGPPRVLGHRSAHIKFGPDMLVSHRTKIDIVTFSFQLPPCRVGDGPRKTLFIDPMIILKTSSWTSRSGAVTQVGACRHHHRHVDTSAQIHPIPTSLAGDIRGRATGPPCTTTVLGTCHYA